MSVVATVQFQANVSTPDDPIIDHAKANQSVLKRQAVQGKMHVVELRRNRLGAPGFSLRV